MGKEESIKVLAQNCASAHASISQNLASAGQLLSSPNGSTGTALQILSAALVQLRELVWIVDTLYMLEQKERESAYLADYLAGRKGERN